jgi:predicted ATPase
LLRDLLTSYFGILDSDAPDVAEARLLETLQALRPARSAPANWPRLFRERVRAVARLVGLDLTPHTETLLEPPPRSAVEQAQDDILEYFELMAANTDAAVVFLEDIHWADSDSLDLIEKLGSLADRTSLVVVALARPQLFDRRPHWLAEADAARHILVLRPLPPDESYRLAGEILRQLPDAPDDLVAMIVRAAGGNPFYMEEMVKVLLGDGVIVKDGVQWRLSVTQLDRLRLPDTLTGILQARMDRLSSIERTTLQQAAVVGNEFWDGSIQQINEAAHDPAAPDEVARSLRMLEEREMIYRVPLSAFAGAQAYQFRHSVLREVAYETILLRDRPYYHSAAAEWLETQSGERVADYAAPIAEHYELAGDQNRAAAFYEVAGRRALSQQRPGRAAEYIGRAITLLQQFPHHIDRRLALLRLLGPALLAKGKTTEALAAFITMEQTAEEAGDLLEQARAALAQVSIYQDQAAWAEMLAAAERATQTASLTGASEEFEQAQAAQIEAVRALGRVEGTQVMARPASGEKRAT